MESLIKTYTYPNGDIQRIQLVRWNDWSQLDFLHMNPSDRTLDCFSAIYKNFLVPAAPWLFGNMILFRLPAEAEVDFPFSTRQNGKVADQLTAAAAALRDGVKIRKGKPVFRNEQVRRFWHILEKHDSVRIVSGKFPTTTVIPLNNRPGVLTETKPEAAMKVNSSFFIMDRFDCATVYDQVGTPFGLCVRNGTVFQPPLYNREALLVKNDGRVTIRSMDVSELGIEINGTIYKHGENAVIYSRPEHKLSPHSNRCSLVIIGNKVAAVCRGRVPVPASGFVLRPDRECTVSPGDNVIYKGLEDILFGIQVGNSIIRDGKKTDSFISHFYDIHHLEPVAYPPSLYPLDFDNARAARIALGADKDGRPMLLWAEGAAKFGYVPGKGSCGASLKEMSDICADVGMYNAVNLDGGGSAQILVDNHRSLMISDRNADDHTEAERPIPLALYIASSK